MEKFEKILGKDNPLTLAIKDRGFSEPSEIQEKSIPKILEGKDVIAIASTGSGKTLAFAAGLVHNIKERQGIQGLILTPTRELAEQITKELSNFSKYKKLKAVAVYGGASFHVQEKNIKNADIIVATPGRMLDHIKQKTVFLGKVNTLVLDEADRMFDMGFRDDVTKIISACPKERQTMLFTATYSPDIERLAEQHMVKPVEISAEQHVDPTKLTQVYYDVRNDLKFSLLKSLLENEKSNLVMVFTNTRRTADFIAKNLQKLNIEAMAIHGGYSQEKRNKTIEKFHSNKVHVMVATDVAARGLDIKGVTHIYNYDIPPTKNEYTHRIGRTARAGKDGKVINLVSNRDYDNFNQVRLADFKIERKETPEIEKIMVRMDDSRSFNTRGSRQRGRGGRGYSRDDNRTNSREGSSFRGRSYGRDNDRTSSGRDRPQRSFSSGGSRESSSRGRSYSSPGSRSGSRSYSRDDNRTNSREGSSYGNRSAGRSYGREGSSEDRPRRSYSNSRGRTGGRSRDTRKQRDYKPRQRH